MPRRSFAWLALSLAAPAVHAQPAPPPDAVDVSPVSDKLNVVTDGKGHYVAFAPPPAGSEYVFYGDGKKFVQQRVFSGSSQGDTQFSRNFWDPRQAQRQGASFEFRDGKYTVECGERKTELTPVPTADLRKMISAAGFVKPSWKWRPYLLARDEHGRYYYVDRQRDPADSRNFRLYVGPKGDLKQQKMTNVVSDSEGDIFATKTGSLRLIAGRAPEGAAHASSVYFWIQGAKKTPLTPVPIEQNMPMIYNELGVYTGEKLGTPCDDL